MSDNSSSNAVDPEIEAIGKVHAALRGLDSEAQERVLAYVGAKLGVSLHEKSRQRARPEEVAANQGSTGHAPIILGHPSADDESDDADSVSSVAQKWMRRSGFSSDDLSKVYSIGLDEIDLIAEKVPGSNKKDRMRSVILLKAVASYLASGAARVSHEQVKEASLHYDAWDSNNFAANLKSFASEINGTKESGYSLTAKGITAATDLVKKLISPSALK